MQGKRAARRVSFCRNRKAMGGRGGLEGIGGGMGRGNGVVEWVYGKGWCAGVVWVWWCGCGLA